MKIESTLKFHKTVSKVGEEVKKKKKGRWLLKASFLSSVNSSLSAFFPFLQAGVGGVCNYESKGFISVWVKAHHSPVVPKPHGCGQSPGSSEKSE